MLTRTAGAAGAYGPLGYVVRYGTRGFRAAGLRSMSSSMSTPHRHSAGAIGAVDAGQSLARREYDLQLHAAYLRLCRAVVQSDHVRSTLAGREPETAD